MKAHIQRKVKIIQRAMDSIRISDKTLHTISFPRLAQELEIPLSELTEFFLSVEDIFVNEQKRVNRKIENFLDNGLKNAKTANEAKDLLETATLKLIELLHVMGFKSATSQNFYVYFTISGGPLFPDHFSLTGI